MEYRHPEVVTACMLVPGATVTVHGSEDIVVFVGCDEDEKVAGFKKQNTGEDIVYHCTDNLFDAEITIEDGVWKLSGVVITDEGDLDAEELEAISEIDVSSAEDVWLAWAKFCLEEMQLKIIKNALKRRLGL